MGSWSNVRDFCGIKESLDPLLPHVAGVIEGMDVATFSDIKNQIETDLETKLSDSELTRALEAGVKLGMFNMNREFKVCREFTTKEIKKLKDMEHNLMAAKSVKKFRTPKTLMDYVRNEREERKKKLTRRRQGKTVGNVKNIKCVNDFYESLCKKCKDNLKKDNGARKSSISSLKDKRNGLLFHYNKGSHSSVDSNKTYDPCRCSDQSENDKSQKRSNLLIQKNSMETEFPYCDIFT